MDHLAKVLDNLRVVDRDTLQLLLYIPRIQFKGIPTDRMGIHKINLRMTHHEAFKGARDISQRGQIDVIQTKGGQDFGSLPGFGINPELSFTSLGGLLQEREPKSDPTGLSGREKGIQNLLEHLFRHTPTVVSDPYPQPITLVILLDADTNQSGPRVEAVFNDVKDVERQLSQLRSDPSPGLPHQGQTDLAKTERPHHERAMNTADILQEMGIRGHQDRQFFRGQLRL